LSSRVLRQYVFICLFIVIVTGYTSVSDILTYVESNKASVWGAVVFDEADYSTTLPNAIQYSLRVAFEKSEKEWFTEFNYPFFRSSGYRNNDSDGGEPSMHIIHII